MLLKYFALDGGVGINPLVVLVLLLTLTVNEALPFVPDESHALTVTLCVPELMLTDWLMLVAEVSCRNTRLEST